MNQLTQQRSQIQVKDIIGRKLFSDFDFLTVLPLQAQDHQKTSLLLTDQLNYKFAE
ncbi:MAG: hypothetical protein KME06_19730 [Kastovskya adunca ATA6-11-RM4]|nr:hypothetical protein [Kastovskya adunca ATA6-11-RM4]